MFISFIFSSLVSCLSLYHSVQFSRSVVSDSLQPHESQQARPTYPSKTPRVHSDSRPLSQWCHPAISSSVVSKSSWPHGLKYQASLSYTVSQSLHAHVHWVTPFNEFILLLPSIFPSIRVFPKESALHMRWPEYWSFSFSISPSNEYSALISFKIYWFDLLAVQGTLKSLLQHHS